MGIFGKLAYDEGATVGTLLAVRFVVAAAAVLGHRRGHRRGWAAAPRSRAATSARASRSAPSATARRPARYFAALERIDASLLSLLLYTFPAIVTVAAIALGPRAGEPAHRRGARSWRAAGSSSCWRAPRPARSTRSGTALALGAAVVYSTYILVSEGVVRARRPARAERARLHRRGGDA